MTTIGGAWGNVFSIAVFAIIASVLWYFFQDPMIKVFAPRAQQAQINPQVIEEYKRQLEIKKIQQEDIIPSTRVVMPYDNLPGALPYSEKMLAGHRLCYAADYRLGSAKRRMCR